MCATRTRAGVQSTDAEIQTNGCFLGKGEEEWSRGAQEEHGRPLSRHWQTACEGKQVPLERAHPRETHFQSEQKDTGNNV